jgi:chromosome segregation protein
MRLDRLEIKGFKSFREKTVLEFPDQFTAIVGPNGSGKSNIVDSICFVLGKSRGLRVNNLKELICNGGVGGKPSEYANVSLYLSDGKKKTKISRGVDQEGHSVYKVDGKRVSRQEIVDLVGDNEYNIILQDDVTKVIEMQPKERRQVIDDLCGIGEYDKKKVKAMKELEKVENRISETHIVLGEKQGYMEQLKRERDDALKYQKLQDELKGCNATILNKNILSHEKKLEGIDLKLKELERDKCNFVNTIENVKKEVSERGKKLKGLNEEILKLEKGRGFAKIPEIKGELMRRQDRIDALKKELENIKNTIEGKRVKRNELIADINGLESKLKAVDKKLEFMDSRIQEKSKAAKGMEFEEKIDNLKAKVFELRSRINALSDSNNADEKRIEGLMDEKAQMENRIDELIKLEKELVNRIKERNKKHKSEFDEFEELKKQIPEVGDRQERIQKLLEGLRVEFAEKKTELETVEKSSGGLQGTMRAINNLKEVVPGVHGPVFQLGTVLNHDYEEAMKVAAGTRMYNIVVENEDSAIKCIKYLREKRIGSATFLPLNKIGFSKVKKPPRDSIGFARDFITTNDKYKPAFDYVFGNTVLVRDLKTARGAGIGKWRMVTLEGDLLSESGAMTGGYRRKIEIGFNRIDELERELKVIEKRIIELDGERQELQIKKDRMRGKLSMLETPVASGRTDVEKIRLERDSVIERIEDLRGRIKEIVNSMGNMKGVISENVKRIKLMEKEITSGGKNLELMMNKRSGAKIDELERLKDEYRDLEIEQKTLGEKRELSREQIGEIDKELKMLGEQKGKGEKDLKEVQVLRSGLEKELLTVEKENTDLMKKIEKLMDKRSELEENITELSSKTGEQDYELDNTNEQINKELVKKATVETKLADLREEFTAFDGVEILEKGFKELESSIQGIQSSIEGIGSVNLRAIDTYEIIGKEFNETMEKLETLKSERQSIFDFMEKVEMKKRETFMQTFDVIKGNFEQIYGELGRGEGTLILDNPRDISESGLLIKASPKGKKLISIDTMSSGEKVLTCSAFLLAIQGYKPSYFYIVDEMDAALDMENSLRLAELMKNSTAQFLLISHNDMVIKQAESVIGVSMNNGISQIVGVKLT